jgi:inosose dehydratase
MTALGSLALAPIGINQILWANDDLPDLTPPIDPLTILDEMARLGYDGGQLGTSFPRGAPLRAALDARNLRIAEVYVALPCTIDGPAPDAAAVGRAALADLDAADGDVLVVALHLTEDRVGHAARAHAPGVPTLTDDGVTALAEVIEGIGVSARSLGRKVAFHHHAGTYVETPAELDRLLAAMDPELVGLCLDVGHYTLAGGDPVGAIGRYGSRIRHVHLKDVDRDVAARMRSGEIAGFLEGIQHRVFTELGRGELDLPRVLGALDDCGYRGWLIAEQDTTWRPPSESAAISRAIVDYTLRELPRMGLVA